MVARYGSPISVCLGGLQEEAALFGAYRRIFTRNRFCRFHVWKVWLGCFKMFQVEGGSSEKWDWMVSLLVSLQKCQAHLLKGQRTRQGHAQDRAP